MNTRTAGNTLDDQPDGRAELEQLADALTQQGYDTTLIIPAPCLAIHIPGTTIPHMIYNSGGHLWWNTAQTIAPAGQTTLAADIITWALRTHPNKPVTHDACSPLATTPGQTPATSGGGQEC